MLFSLDYYQLLESWAKIRSELLACSPSRIGRQRDRVHFRLHAIAPRGEDAGKLCPHYHGAKLSLREFGAGLEEDIAALDIWE